MFLEITCVARAADNGKYAILRENMIKEMEIDMKGTDGVIGRQSFHKKVMDAMSKVPRHEFVQSHLKPFAYLNRPLPIGHGQTVSQPFIVALMTDLLEIDKGDTVLEIGAGSGYHSAVLAELAKEVYTIEIIKDLGEQARKRLRRLNYKNIRVRVADGYYGWDERSPFDAVIVTCAAGHIPPPLLKQLKPGGRMVIPIGGVYDVQMLMIVTKDVSGTIKTRQVIPVRFVPMTGRAGKPE